MQNDHYLHNTHLSHKLDSISLGPQLLAMTDVHRAFQALYGTTASAFRQAEHQLQALQTQMQEKFLQRSSLGGEIVEELICTVGAEFAMFLVPELGSM